MSMNNILQGSLFWRALCALGLFFRRTAEDSRLICALSRIWRSSRTRALLSRFLASDPVCVEQSAVKNRFDRLNVRLADAERLRSCVSNSLLARIYGWILNCGRNSRILGWLFSGGMTALLLFAVGLYAGIDYVLRDVLSIPVISSVWDEGLLLVGFVWVLWQRTGRVNPLSSRLNPLDVPVLLFFTVSFVLLCTVCPYFSIQVSGFRAACQYLLWFFVITRLLRDDRDLMVLYLSLVCLGTAIALHGIYQYIVKVPIPASWMTHTETAVRTRVYSIFGSPNIMGDFMVMLAPMAAALAYFVKDKRLKVLAWVCAFLMCFGCLFTMSKASWTAMALAIVIFVLLVDRRLFTPLAVGGIIMLCLPFVRNRLGFLFTDEFSEANLSGGRGGRKLNAMILFSSCNPWLGLGHGMFGGAVAMQNKVLDHTDYFYVDNYFLKVMLETGYLGLGSFIAMMAGFLITSARSVCRSAKTWKDGLSRRYPLVCGMFAGLCGVLLHCGFENIFEEPYMMVYFWAIAAMIVWAGFLGRNCKNNS